MSLPPRRSEYCRNETCFVKEQKKRQPRQLQGNSRKKPERGRPPWGHNKWNKCSRGQKEQKWSAALTMSVSMSNKIFCFFVTGQEVKPMWIVALEMFTADWRWTCNVGERKNKRLALCIAQACERKNYSEQYKRYNLSQGHHCGWTGSETVVRTALVYYCVHSGLYTSSVHSVQWCWSLRNVAVLVWPRTRGVGGLHSSVFVSSVAELKQFISTLARAPTSKKVSALELDSGYSLNLLTQFIWIRI